MRNSPIQSLGHPIDPRPSRDRETDAAAASARPGNARLREIRALTGVTGREADLLSDPRYVALASPAMQWPLIVDESLAELGGMGGPSAAQRGREFQ